MSKAKKQPSAGGRKQGEAEAAKPAPLMKLALCLTPREQRRLAGAIDAHKNRRPEPRN